MIELKILDFVEAALLVPVSTEIPANPDPRFVVLTLSGMGRENYLESANLIADSYAESKLEAAKLNAQVKTVLDRLDTLNDISGVHLVSDYPLTDTGSKRYRYQAVYEVNHY